MRFTPTTAALVLAYASSALAAPHIHAREESTAVVSAPAPGATDSVSATQAPTGLSVTQQLVLADLASDRFNILNNDEDFKTSLRPGNVPEGRGGVLTAANRKTFPALVGTGAGMAVGTIRPCGINTFHVHPRSAELQMVISGELVTEMVPENGVRPIRNTVGPFEMTPFYQGSVHHQFNPRCEDAVFVAAFAAEDFGTGQVLNEVFELDQDAIVDTFGGSFSGDMIEAIRGRLPESVVLGVETCLKECGGQEGGNSDRPQDGSDVSDDIGNDATGDVGGGVGGDIEGDATEGDATDGDATEGDETEGDETGEDETGEDGTGEDETGEDETGEDETEGDETGGDETGEEETEGADTEGEETEADETEEVEE